jgi:hypothetical protein
MAILLTSEPFNKQSNGRNRKHVKAKCLECGCEFEPRYSEINRIKSCGCTSRYKKTHGGSRSRIYKIWQGMLARCHNKNSDKYELYGARGIEVCKRWRESFESFVADMGDPESNQTIDRIDSNGNYEPSNCRWADCMQQNNNKRTNKRITIDGVTKTVAEWVRSSPGINYTTVTERLSRGWAPKDAVFTKVTK